MSKGTALITGGAIRLGKIFSETLADAGYKLAIHYNSSSEKAAITAEEFKKKVLMHKPFSLILVRRTMSAN